jgi:hypothetical protein
VALYLGLAGGVGGFLITRLGAHSTWVTVVATLAASAVFVPVRDKVQRIVDGRFFRRREDRVTEFCGGAFEEDATVLVVAVSCPS